MNRSVKMFIHAISGKINENLTEVYKNHKDMSGLLHQAESPQISLEIAKKYDTNKMLLMENHDLINMKLLLQNFIDRETGIKTDGVETISTHYSENSNDECHAINIDGRFFNIQYPPNSNNSYFLKMKIFINMLNLQSLN